MKNPEKTKRKNRIKRHKRVRSKVFGTKEVPRLNVFRSNKGLFVQVIDDETNATLASIGEKEIKSGKNKLDRAKEAGKLIAQKSKEKKISKVVFDRGGYNYHGRVKALAEGAREGGLEF